MDKHSLVVWALELAIKSQSQNQWFGLMKSKNPTQFEDFKKLTLLEILTHITVEDLSKVPWEEI